jgi:ubiquinone/menaquinone biosynthesis C-methylase UbiE
MGFYNKYILPKIINAGCGTKPIRKQREKVLPLCKGIVLEIGCGSGLNFSFYEENNIDKLYALEPDKEMLRQAESVVKEVNFPITFLETGAEKIPLEDDSIDTALLTYTLCTIPDPLAALLEIRRVLKKGGKLVFCEHGMAPENNVKKMQNFINSFWPIFVGGCNLNRDIPSLIKDAGFLVDNLETMYLPKTPKWFGYNYWGSAS